MSLESRSRVTVNIDYPGLGGLGTFTTRTGGNADSEETKHAPGGMEGEEALGGRPTTENVTTSRRFKPDRDGPLRNALFAARGASARMTVVDQPLGPDGNAWGSPTVWTGVLKSFNMPDSDANSNDVAMFELEQSTDALVAA